MQTVFTSMHVAARIARRLSRDTEQRHVARPFALGNKLAFQIVNVERFST